MSSKYKASSVTSSPYLDSRGNLTQEDKDRLTKTFYAVAGTNRELDVDEFRKVVNDAMKLDFPFDGFSREVCRSMVALGDDNLNGMLGLKEALEFWTEMRQWEQAFRRFDTDKSGYFYSFEWKNLLEALGLNLGPKMVKALHARYADKQGKVYFNEYVAAMLKLAAMVEIFHKHQSTKNGPATFQSDEFIQLTLYS